MSTTFVVPIWIFRLPLAGAIAAKIGVRQAVDLGLTALADFLFCFPTLRFVRKADWRPEVKVCIGALLIGVAIWTTKVIAPALATDVASYLAIATTIAGISVFSVQQTPLDRGRFTKEACIVPRILGPKRFGIIHLLDCSAGCVLL